jgi:hypothetical protein
MKVFLKRGKKSYRETQAAIIDKLSAHKPGSSRVLIDRDSVASYDFEWVSGSG